jgi:hypothetical protein
MTQGSVTDTPLAAELSDIDLAGLPEGWATHRVAFTTAADAGDAVVMDFPPAFGRRAVLVERAPAALTVLSIPSPAREAQASPDAAALALMHRWVENGTPRDDAPAMLMTLQGAQVCWAEGRCAIMAMPSRLEAARRVLIEAAFFDLQLREVERDLAKAWPHLENDVPLAFDFDDRAAGRIKELRGRHQQALRIHARLAQVRPYVYLPHQHPATLASQIGERLRERLRLTQRQENQEAQLEVVKDIYEKCGERASDFTLASKGFKLEWTIIVLLLVQTVFWAVDILATISE